MIVVFFLYARGDIIEDTNGKFHMFHFMPYSHVLASIASGEILP